MTKKLTLVDEYQKAIMALDSKLKKPNLELNKVPKLQEQLADIADEYQSDERIGTERYRIYELQGLIYFYQHQDTEALEYLELAINTLGHSYEYAQKLQEQIEIQNKNLGRRSYTNWSIVMWFILILLITGFNFIYLLVFLFVLVGAEASQRNKSERTKRRVYAKIAIVFLIFAILIRLVA